MKENFPNKEITPERIFPYEEGLRILASLTGIDYRTLFAKMSKAIRDGCDDMKLMENKAAGGNIMITFINHNASPKYRYQYTFHADTREITLDHVAQPARPSIK